MILPTKPLRQPGGHGAFQRVSNPRLRGTVFTPLGSLADAVRRVVVLLSLDRGSFRFGWPASLLSVGTVGDGRADAGFN